jgi:phytoene dehydrogenase-like protein
LFERMSETGGRSRTRVDRGFAFNMGPHALYQAGAAMGALRELGVEPAGNPPPTSGGLAYRAGALHALPGGAVSLMTTGLLGVSDKLELAKLLSNTSRLGDGASGDVSTAEFLGAKVRSERVRELLFALVRLTSYTGLVDQLSAEAGIAQVLSGIGPGVRYLHGGWQTLVDALEQRAREAGVELQRGVKVERVVHDDAVRGVELAGGERVSASAVILALGPDEASAMVDGGRQPFLARAASQCLPVRAACLDVALKALPNLRHTFALGVDRPLYFSVHSASAALAPAGGAAICLVRYLGADERPEREELEAELHALLDAMQPGWRELVVTRKLMRDLLVANDIPQASRGGLAGRTPSRVTGIANLWLAGDWIGPTGQLLDASLASARLAAHAAAASLAGARAAA